MKNQRTTPLSSPEHHWSIADQINAHQQRRAELLLQHRVRSLAREHGALAAIADALAASARALFPIVDGQPRLPQAMTLADWVSARLAAIAASAPDPVAALAKPNPFAPATWNLTRQMRLQKLNPGLAARLKAAAN